jgi:hypothetical protein
VSRCPDLQRFGLWFNVRSSTVRDAWDSKKPEYGAEISKMIGEAWTVDANPNLIYVYADDNYKDRVGTVLTW